MPVQEPFKTPFSRGFASTKLLLIMKLTVLLTMVAFLQASAHLEAQKVTIAGKSIPLSQVFKEIKRQTGCNFFYNNRILRHANRVDIDAREAPLRQVLDECLKDQPLSYVLQDNIIVISEKTYAPAGNGELASIDITGRVTDAAGKPLEGVSVRVKGMSRGTSTAADGSFTLKGVKENAVLEISYVGYAPQSIAVNKRTDIAITLSLETRVEEAVIVTYGTQRRREIVGAVTQLNAADMKDMPTGTFADRLQGKVTGVQINNSTGRPGQGIDFRIRGAVSFNASNRPLFVIDGIPISGETDNINSINPDEIETFTVLKDASATALYGSRASNGVILITTKRAKAGQSTVELNAYNGIAAFPNERRPGYMNATELATYMKAFYEDKIKYEGYTGGVPAAYQNPAQYGKGTDWLGLMLRNAPVTDFNITVANDRERSSTSLIGGYLDQQGIMKNTGYKRFSVRLNNEYKPNEYVKLGVNLAPTLQLEHNTRVANIDGQRQIVAAALYMPPMGAYKNPDGTLTTTVTGFPNLFTWPNMYRVLLLQNDDYTRYRLLGNAYAEIRFLKDFVFRSVIDVDVNGLTRKNFLPSTAQGTFNSLPPQPATGISAFNNNYTWTNENTLTWQKMLGDHNIQALAGYTAQRFNDYRNNINGNTYPNDNIPYLNYAAVISSYGSSSEVWTLLSMIGRVNYSYKNKYFLQGAIRRDGSSRFGTDKQYGYFPSVGAGWVVSDESFMKAARPVSFLKLRASYGITGNNTFNTINGVSGNYPSIALTSAANYVFGSTLAQGLVQSTLGNSLLSWERNKQLDLGIDISVLNNRISLTYDYYHRITDGLLYQVDVPRGSGFSSVPANIGAVKLWGHEISVSSRNLVGALKWNSTVNISFDRNIVTRLGTSNAPISAVGSNTFSEFTDFRTEVGKPLGQFYGYVFDGVFMTQAEYLKGPKYYTGVSTVGTARMKDLNGDNIIDPTNDRTYIGNPNPSFVFGITNTLSYRNFDMNIVFSGTYGNKIKDGMAESGYNLDGVFNGPKELLHHWRSESDPGNGQVPRTLAGTTAYFRADNSKFIYDGSHLTCNNITLGYTLPINPSFRYIKKLRCYASAQQAFVLTSYPGMNPEVNQSGLNGTAQGQDLGNYPIPRTFTFGINVGL